MARKPQYTTLLTSKKFRTREEAEEFGRQKKQDYKRQGESVKIDINFDESISYWVCKVYLKVS